MLHQWEEPGISVGAGSGAVFFAGCPLRCAYCQNRAISRAAAGTVYEPRDLAKVFSSLEAQGAANLNLVTPTHFAAPIREAIRLAREAGFDLPVIWNTSGYENASAIRQNEGCVDVYLTDFKYADGRLAEELSHAKDYPEAALRALSEMVRCTGSLRWDAFDGEERLVSGCVVRHLVLPGHADASCAVLELLWREFGDAIKLSLMSQYTPVLDADDPVLAAHPGLGRTVSAEEYEQVLDCADELGFQDYFWQEGGAAEESFIPAFSPAALR